MDEADRILNMDFETEVSFANSWLFWWHQMLWDVVDGCWLLPLLYLLNEKHTTLKKDAAFSTIYS